MQDRAKFEQNVTAALDHALRMYQSGPTFGGHDPTAPMIAATARPGFYEADAWRKGIALAAALQADQRTATIALRGDA